MGQTPAEHHLLIEEQLRHDQVHDLLYAYAHERLMRASHTRYPVVAEHLAQCEVCRTDLQELLELMEIATTATYTASVDNPKPDLSKLPRPWQQKISASRPWFIDQFGQLWLETNQQVLQSWEPSALLGAVRGSLLYTHVEDAVSNDPGLNIAIYAEDDPALALLSITVDDPQRDALDQSHIPVTLYIDGTARQAKTDSSGTVRFTHIPRAALATLRLAITLDQSG